MSVPFEPVRKITIALPGELVEYADRQARRSRTNRSQVIGQALAQARARDQELLASQGYRFYAAEAAAWYAALGPHTEAIPAAAVTGTTGSMFAGAGAVEIAVAAMAMESQTIPPTANFSVPAGDHLPGVSRTGFTGPFEYALTGAFTMGGQSAACVLKRCEP